MYCVKCGIKLGDAEEKCPLCSTVPGQHQEERPASDPLYPSMLYPEKPSGHGARNGAIIFLFAIPLLLSLFIDLQIMNGLQWFWYVAGALLVLYVVAALPAWFTKPNPVIFVPCDFAAAALYLLLVNYLTEGNWFLTFALPITGSACLLTTALVTLLRYIRRGRLFIHGGACIFFGLQLLLVEWLLTVTFPISFIGWSVYPLITLALIGGLLIFLGINDTAREKMERRFFL